MTGPAKTVTRCPETDSSGAVALPSARFGYWIWDRRAGHCLHCCPALPVLFDATEAEIARLFGSPEAMRARLDPSDAEQYCARIAACKSGGAGYTIDYRIVTASGDLRRLRESGQCIPDADGTALFDLRIVEDADRVEAQASEIEAIQKQLAQRAAGFARLAEDLDVARRNADEARRLAEDANRAKSEFLANISHELRTPLNAVIGFAQIMGAEMFGALGNDRYREYCRDILASGNHLLEVINQLLDLSKIEAGRTELQDEEVDIAYVIDVCRTLIRDRADRKNITVTVAGDSFPLVRGDDRSFRQILLNLLGNAVKFTRPGGCITIDSAVEPCGAARVTVVDTGVGMPPEQLARIGEPFAQGNNSLVADEIGTGLGLSIVKSLVELHGGTLRIASAVGVGTTVSVFLPAERILAIKPVPRQR